MGARFWMVSHPSRPSRLRVRPRVRAVEGAATPAGVGEALGTGDPGLLRNPGYRLQRLRRSGAWDGLMRGGAG